MTILIDGYNLLHAIGIAERTIGPGTLDRARKALLGFLSVSLDAEQRAVTTVVFDSEDAPPGLPREIQHQEMTVRYATGYESADELLEELIQQMPNPRKMTVVSSDHRVQRAAKRRKARAVDSEVWYEEVQTTTNKSTQREPTTLQKPKQSLTDEEITHWVEAFGDIVVDQRSHSDDVPSDQTTATPIDNPFPPGYGEDLLGDS